ncbi:MAG: phage antirepressor N-terminal domain-containing protein [Victivallaceae bacterium]|jgi:hypothetical protein
MITIKEMLEKGCLLMIQSGGNLYIPLKPIIEILELDRDEQLNMLRNDPVFSKALTPLVIPDGDGGTTEVLGLTMPYLTGWTLRLNPNAYSGKLKDDIVELQRKCFHTLGMYMGSQA